MTPKPVIAFDWYRSFIEFLANSGTHVWFSKVIVFGELAVALGFDSRGVHQAGGIFWRAHELELHHGGIGPHQRTVVRDRDLVSPGMAQRRLDRLDRWLLPVVGTPWKPGRLFDENRTVEAT
jgi:thiosulfate dehydrogenase [quinone] large subunit